MGIEYNKVSYFHTVTLKWKKKKSDQQAWKGTDGQHTTRYNIHLLQGVPASSAWSESKLEEASGKPKQRSIPKNNYHSSAVAGL